MALKEDSQYDGSQVLPRVYDNNKGVLKVWPTDGTNGLTVNPDGSINVNVQGNVGTTLDDIQLNTLPDLSLKTCFSFTALANTFIKRFDITAGSEVLINLKVDGVLKRVARTSPSNRNVTIDFTRELNLSIGQVVELELKLTNNYTQLPIDTAISMEGYIV